MNAARSQRKTNLPERTIRLGQALHGYADGHQLLAGSEKLSRLAARQMNILSDLSGPEVVAGFDTYLTGYPITDSRKYAFARTWYAPEMKRPGCVWTHTLLLDVADLAQIEDLRMLLKFFKRPVVKDQNWLENYQEPIVTDLDSNEVTITNKPENFVAVPTAEIILYGLYEQPEKYVYVLSIDADSCLDFILRLWSQQWPRLRRSFSFTTGALSLRENEDVSKFDLQIIPLGLQKQVQHMLHKSNVWIASDSLPLIDDLSWYRDVIDDLKNVGKSKLRDFLWRSGVHLKERRAAFAPLMRLYKHLSKISSDGFDTLIVSLAELFPQSDNATALKSALLTTPPLYFEDRVPFAGETKLLASLTKTPHYAAFDPITLNLRERAIALMDKNRKDAIQLAESLSKIDRTPLAEAYLTGVLQSINADELVVLGQWDDSLVAEAITFNLDLVKDKKLWQGMSAQRAKLLARLQNKLGDKVIEEILPILLDTEPAGLADDVAQIILPDVLVVNFLQWFNQKDQATSDLPHGWRKYLSSHKAQMTAWLRKQPPKQIKIHTGLLFIELLNPHELQTIQLSADVWEPLAGQLGDISRHDLQQRAAAFLLALGFHNPSPSGAGLVSASFAHVYLAARENRLDERNWNLLREQAPSDWFWEDWDKCARLACALLEHFTKFDWPVTFFAKAITDDEMWGTVSKRSKKHGYWRRFFNRAF